jgi:hypothetical protein
LAIFAIVCDVDQEAMIVRHTEEAQRPAEWLLRFEQEPRLYRALLRDSGNLAVAAYRLARARCRIQPTPARIPSRTELWAAARAVVHHTQLAERPPSRSWLEQECEARGLLVIGPVPSTHAA